MKNKWFITILMVVTTGIIASVFVSIKKTDEYPVSDYTFKDVTKYDGYFMGSEIDYIWKSTTGEKIGTGSFQDDLSIGFGTLDDKIVLAISNNVSNKLPAIIYFPKDKVIYKFGQDKPINIVFGAPASESEDPYDSPLYIGYYDGTCEYPAEFDYVRSKKKCSQYLQDTLDFVGFDTVDEMLEYSFGDYLIKEDSEESEIE